MGMKLLIADDHTLFRDALVQYIERTGMDVSICVAKDFFESFEAVKKNPDYDLILMDLRMPGMDGMEGFRKMRETFPDVPAALMSGVAEKEDVEQAMALGAVGYFPKTLSGKALIKGIKSILDGETFVPLEKKTNTIMPAYYADSKPDNFQYRNMTVQRSAMETDNYNLTPREKEVLEFLARGASNKEIANALELQVVTVKLHVRGVCRKLEAANRTQAALKATQLGLVAASRI